MEGGKNSNPLKYQPKAREIQKKVSLRKNPETVIAGFTANLTESSNNSLTEDYRGDRKGASTVMNNELPLRRQEKPPSLYPQ